MNLILYSCSYFDRNSIAALTNGSLSSVSSAMTDKLVGKEEPQIDSIVSFTTISGLTCPLSDVVPF